MRTARVVFLVAGLWGLAVLLPMYWALDAVAERTPPPVTHPEFYFGFVSVAVPWQLAFLPVASDPGRYRPLMPIAALEKFGFAVAVGVLYAQQRVAFREITLGAAVDFVLGVLFVLAYLRTAAATASHNPHTS